MSTPTVTLRWIASEAIHLHRPHHLIVAPSHHLLSTRARTNGRPPATGDPLPPVESREPTGRKTVISRSFLDIGSETSLPRLLHKISMVLLFSSSLICCSSTLLHMLHKIGQLDGRFDAIVVVHLSPNPYAAYHPASYPRCELRSRCEATPSLSNSRGSRRSAKAPSSLGRAGER